MGRIKKDKKPKEPESDKDESEAKKEEKMDHQGKLNEVPWSAVQAYLMKYKGIGRFMERFNESSRIKNGGSANSKIVKHREVEQKGGSEVDLKTNKPPKPYGGKMKSGAGYVDKNGKYVSNVEMQMKAQKEEAPTAGEDAEMKQDSMQEMGGSMKRGASEFYPVSSDSESDDDEYEELHHDHHQHLDGYAPSMMNLMTKSHKPSEEHMNAIMKMGNDKSGLINIEIQLAKRAKDVLVNEESLKLFTSRLEMMVEAQRNDSEEVVELQPGDADPCSEAFKILLTESGEQTSLDLSVFDQDFQNAIRNSHNFDGFIITVAECLERNVNFELDYANFFSAQFCDYLSRLISSYNSDFICKIVAKNAAIYNTIEAIAQFFNALLYFVTQKKLTIERVIDFQAKEGVVLAFSDLELNKSLALVDDMNQTLDKLITSLESHHTRVHASLKHGGAFFGAPHRFVDSIRKRLDAAKLAKEKLSSPEKEGSGMAQTMDTQPSAEEQQSLAMYANVRQIGSDDQVLGVIRQLVIAKIEKTKEMLQDSPFVNLIPLNDLEYFLRLSGNSTVMSKPEMLDGTDATSGADIWQAEAENLLTGGYSFDVMKKIVLAQGYIQSLRLNQERARQLIHNIAIRIGIDPLAPRIITKNMSEILGVLGYYVEENVGIQQAMDQLSRNIKFTNEMDDDLGKCMASIKAGPEGLTSGTFVDSLLNSILKSFGAPIRANDYSEVEKVEMSSLICPACNRVYSTSRDSIPLTVQCGDVQCLGCCCSLRSCFICSEEINNVPDMPAAYNPTVHLPMNFIAGLKANAQNMKEYLMMYCTKASNYTGSFTNDQMSSLAFLSQINSELSMCKHTSNILTQDKIDRFFKDIITCSSPPQLLKIVCQMLDKQSLDFCKSLIERAMLAIDLLGDSKTVKYITANVVQAIVSASKLPGQPLLMVALISGGMDQMQAYCSSDNISLALDIFKSRQVFFTSTHIFSYNECIPMALEILTKIITSLSSDDFDHVLPLPLRGMMLKQTQETIVMVQEAAKSENLTSASHYLREYFDMFYDTTFVYLYPTGAFNDEAKIKVLTLLNAIKDDLIVNMTKKYPSLQSMDIDPILVDMKYVEVMMNKQKEMLHEIFDFGITNAATALAKEAEFNAAVQAGSKMELGREKLQWSGIKIEVPTDNSALKNLPPYICAVSAPTPGADQATPLYNYMMADGSFLDNPYNVRKVPEMELAHTEGPLYYAGWDGFMEEYQASSLDPLVVDSKGMAQPQDAFFNVKQILETASYIQNSANTPSNIIGSDLGVRMQAEYARIKLINDANKQYYTNLFRGFFKSPLVKGAANFFFGPNANQGLDVLNGLVDAYDKPESYHNSAADWLGSRVGQGVPYGGSIRKGTATDLHNPAHVKDYTSSRGGAIKDIMSEHVNHTKNRLNGMTLIKPVMEALKMKAMRKKMHDVNDEATEKHGLGVDKVDPVEVPKCGHCGGTHNLHVMTKGNPECVCEHCKTGKGITASRRIINPSNSEPLALHDPKASHSTKERQVMSDTYNKFVRQSKGGSNVEKPKDTMQPINYQWRKFAHSAAPHFKTHPDQIIHNFSQHKIREPLNYSPKHLVKNTALLAGKMHSMMNIERRNHHPEHLENLRHNYHWHVAHLPDKKGKPFRPFQAHDFQEMAAGISENPHQMKQMSNNMVANNYI